jgi:hypothetical protein
MFHETFNMLDKQATRVNSNYLTSHWVSTLRWVQEHTMNWWNPPWMPWYLYPERKGNSLGTKENYWWEQGKIWMIWFFCQNDHDFQSWIWNLDCCHMTFNEGIRSYSFLAKKKHIIHFQKWLKNFHHFACIFCIFWVFAMWM